MLELLRQIAQRTSEEHPYFSSRAARQLARELETLDKSAPDHRRWELHSKLGDAELLLGHTQSSIDHQLQAYRYLTPDQQAGHIGNQSRFRLGVAYLRLGETQNCCQRHTPESCIVPIRAGGLHTQRQGSEQAIEYLQKVLDHGIEQKADTQLYLAARWLLNIAFMTLGGYPDQVPKEHVVDPSVFRSEVDFPRFHNVAPQLGLDTFSLSGGVIVDDFDNDDYLDIVTSTWDTTGQLRLFRNNRDGTFSDRTEAAGLSGLYGGLNIVSGDYNNDGRLDFLVLRGAWLFEAGRHPNSLIRNNADGTFTDVTFDAGLGEVHYPTQTAAWADFDNDGDLDLYIGNEHGGSLNQFVGGGGSRFAAVEPGSQQRPAPGQLFRNNGDGTFSDVAAAAGVDQRAFAKGVCWGDYDGDRFADLYVSNLDGPNRLYHNNGDGTFTDVAPRIDVTAPFHSFPTWFWDFDNDGALDLFVSSYSNSITNVVAHHLGLGMKFDSPRLYRGDERGGFTDVTDKHKLNQPTLTMGSNFGDLDNDGYLDAYLGTGDIHYHVLVPNLMFLNRAGDGFVNVTMAGGFGHLQKGHGISFADLDHDGDLDVFEQMGGAFPGDGYGDALFENPGFGNRWITVKLVGVQSNRSAIGARIQARITEEGTTRSIYRYVNSGGSFGANPLRQTIGLGKATRIDRLEVFWPRTGRTQRFDDVPVDQTITITEGKDQYERLDLKTLRFRSPSP